MVIIITLLIIVVTLYLSYLLIKWGYIFIRLGKDENPPEANLSGKLHEPPSTLKPYFVDTLVNKSLTPSGRSISATLLELVRLKFIKISYTAGEYLLELDEKRLSDILKLPRLEQRLISFIFQGSENTINFAKIKTYGTRYASITHKFWQFWKDEILYHLIKSGLVDEEGYYAKNYFPNEILILAGLIINFIYLGIRSGLSIFFILCILTFITLTIISILKLFMNKRTYAGNIEYSKWLAFKNWLEAYSVTESNPIDSVILWEKYLVYGVALGVSKKALSELPINFNMSDFGNSINSPYDIGLFISEVVELVTFVTGVGSNEDEINT